MALRTMEGFDDGLAALRHSKSDGVVSSSYGKDGNGVRVGDDTGDTFGVVVDGQSGDVNTVGFNVYVTAASSGKNVCGASQTFTSAHSSNASIYVEVDSSLNRLVVHDMTGSTNTANNTFYLDTWYYLELQWTVGNSPTGQWELKLDGVTVASETSRDVLDGTNYPIYFRIGGLASTDVDNCYIDNFYQTDDSGSSNTGFLGICQVETDLPSGNGNSSDLVGSDGNSTDNYLLVDNNASVPPVTTEYVESATEGDKDTYAMTDLTTTGTVYGVMTSMYAQKDDAGAKYVRPVIRSGGTDYPGASVALSNGTYAPFDECWDVDPNTSSAWAYTAVNAMELGPEVRDS